MKKPSTSRAVMITLCVFALLMAQAFGIRASYLCVCGEQPVPTQMAACHGPVGGDCAARCMEKAASDREHDSGDCQNHVVVPDETPRLTETSRAPMGEHFLIAILPVISDLWAATGKQLAAEHPDALGKSPPFGVAVARTVVLRI